MPKEFLFILIMLVLFYACTQEKERQVQKQALPFTLSDTALKHHSLADYRNKIVMVNFWADWCPSCRKEFPRLQQVYDSLKASGFEILAVNAGQSMEHVRQIQQEYQLTFPVLVDEESRIAKSYGVKGLPSSYFIDKKGVIRKVVVGWMKKEEIMENFTLIREDRR
jgi:peroxiredoxin